MICIFHISRFAARSEFFRTGGAVLCICAFAVLHLTSLPRHDILMYPMHGG